MANLFKPNPVGRTPERQKAIEEINQRMSRARSRGVSLNEIKYIRNFVHSNKYANPFQKKEIDAIMLRKALPF